MTGGLWNITTGGNVSLSAATAKTVIGARAHANSSIYLKKWRVSFKGVVASAEPVLIEVCQCTFGANPPGTNSTSVTPVLSSGRSTTAGWTAAKNWTTEPTTITVLEEVLLTPNGGVLVYDAYAGDETDTALNEGLVLRLTAQASVDCRAAMLLGRC